MANSSTLEVQRPFALVLELGASAGQLATGFEAFQIRFADEFRRSEEQALANLSVLKVQCPFVFVLEFGTREVELAADFEAESFKKRQFAGVQRDVFQCGAAGGVDAMLEYAIVKQHIPRDFAVH